MNLTDKQIKAMKKDFRNYAHVIWMHLELPPLTPIQNDICTYLQHGGDRIQIAAFRGAGKSYLTSAYVTWLLWKDKEHKVMVVSAGRDRADAFAIFVRNIIRDVPFLNHLEPDKSKGERATQNNFDVNGCKPSGSPSVKSIGISGQLTGSRADTIIADDIEVVSNCATHDLREKLVRLVSEFDAVIKPDVGRIIYLGTMQTELSLYNVLYTKGYDLKIWCARVPTELQAANYGAKLARIIRDMMLTKEAGTSTDPLRFDDEDLAKRELSYGRSGFALQFMLDTSLSDGDKFPLKIDDLVIGSLNDKLPEEIYWSNNPLMCLKDLPNVAMAGQKYYAPEKLSDAHAAPQLSILSIDPSGRGKDETGYAVLQLLNGNIFCRKFGGMIGGYTDESLSGLANIAKMYKVNKIVIESNFGDGMYSKLLTPHVSKIYPVEIEEVRATAQKELRIIDALEPVMNQHRLIFDAKTVQEDYDSARAHFSPDKAPQYMLFYQLSRLSKERGSLRHDDRLDALAQGVKYFLDYLDVDQSYQKKIRSEESTDRLLAGFANDWLDEHKGSKQNNIRLWRK